MKTIYLLESANPEKREAIFKFKKDAPGARWKTINVSISPLLANRIANNSNRGLIAGDTLVGTEFKSELTSAKYEECPLKLVRFVPTNGSDVPVNYRVELVFEMRSIKSEISDIFQRKVDIWKSRRFRPSQYRRYVSVEVSKKLAECGLGLHIVTP